MAADLTNFDANAYWNGLMQQYGGDANAAGQQMLADAAQYNVSPNQLVGIVQTLGVPDPVGTINNFIQGQGLADQYGNYIINTSSPAPNPAPAPSPAPSPAPGSGDTPGYGQPVYDNNGNMIGVTGGPPKQQPPASTVGGNPDATSVTQNELPTELKPLAKEFTSKAIKLSNTPFQYYNQARFAGFTPEQMQAMQMIAGRARKGSPLTAAGTNALIGLLGGWNVPSWQGNNQYLGATTPQANWTFSGAPETNPYAGLDNPYLQKTIDYAQADAYRALNPMFQAQQRASGSFGNSGLAEAQTRQAADVFGNIANQARMQDYGTQQQLAESAIGRGLQNQQFNVGNYNQMGQFNANLGLSDIGRNASLAQDVLNNKNQFGLNAAQLRSSNMFNALSQAPTYADAPYKDAAQLMNIGQMGQDAKQQNLDFAYQQFQDAQNDPYKKLSAMGGVFGTNLGGTSVTKQYGGTGGGK